MIKKLNIQKITKRNINLGIILILFIFTIYLDWSLETSALLAFFIYSLLNDFGADYYKNISFVFAIMSAAAMVKSDQSISEKLGVVSFLALIIYMVLIFNSLRKKK